PMWTAIFILAGAAFVMGYHRAPNQETIRMLVILFIVNGLFNFIWSVLYFRMQRPDWALIEAVGLWLSVLAIVLATRSYSPISSLLMLPYLAWVSVAMLLNWTTIQLNGPFGRG
ncbi:MAG: TspO/MBR family protein, partial [Polynucleobacter sp.]